MDTCPNCGSTNLTWGWSTAVTSSAPDGRLRANETHSEFHLGCDVCSETLVSRVHPDEVAQVLTEHSWRPRTVTTTATL